MNSRNVPLNRVVDLTDPDKNVIFNMTVDEARELVRTGPAIFFKSTPVDENNASMASNRAVSDTPSNSESQLYCKCVFTISEISS